MDPKIADYIRAHRDRYTREAITQQLIAAGYEPAAVEATWDALRGDAANPPPRRRGAGYVMTVYLLGLAGMLVIVALSGLQLFPFVVVLVVAYALVGYLIARVWAPRATMGIWLALAVPFVFLLIGFGSCVAAIYAGGFVPQNLGPSAAPTPASFVVPPIEEICLALAFTYSS
ncbi:MAG: hypothetical protein M3R49_12820 [Chloroflexota bacterium]|nr:hypothetical protein [Chloroflexota bacterium]